MFFAGLLSANNPLGENPSRFGSAMARREHSPVLVISGNVFGVTTEQLLEVRFRGGDIAFLHAFHRQAVAAEGIEGIVGDELLEHLPAF